MVAYGLPAVVYQWDRQWDQPGARLYMGLPKKLDKGTGFKRLEQGDDPHECRYCGGSLIYKYPHHHTKADHDRHWGKT